jgi:hypothetical protein
VPLAEHRHRGGQSINAIHASLVEGQEIVQQLEALGTTALALRLSCLESLADHRNPGA